MEGVVVGRVSEFTPKNEVLTGGAEMGRVSAWAPESKEVEESVVLGKVSRLKPAMDFACALKNKTHKIIIIYLYSLLNNYLYL